MLIIKSLIKNFFYKSKEPKQYWKQRPNCGLFFQAKVKQNIAELERNAAALGTKGLNALVKSKIIIIIY
jgi:hypothetical protein